MRRLPFLSAVAFGFGVVGRELKPVLAIGTAVSDTKVRTFCSTGAAQSRGTLTGTATVVRSLLRLLGRVLLHLGGDTLRRTPTPASDVELAEAVDEEAEEDGRDQDQGRQADFLFSHNAISRASHSTETEGQNARRACSSC